MNSLKKVAITTGDTDGIGLEVSAKGLSKVGPQRNCAFYMWRSPQASKNYLKLLDKKFDRIQVSDFSEAKKIKPKNSQLIEIVSEKSPALWVQDVAELCMSQDIGSMVTAPLSKQSVIAAGLSDMGHTDILKRVSKSSHAFMGFIGKYFNVILVSGHIPLNQVESKLTSELIQRAVNVSLQSRKFLDKKSQKRPIAILGLNPHAGDQGLIGDFEQKTLEKMISSKNLQGPLVPDAAFLKNNWSKYSFYLALYHDQGLIPFKTVHGFDSGVHLTLGLPIKRTSVDHGTAKDIFGKNKANPGSMIEAIKWGVKLCTIQ